jgi:CheY-like chemotaxis protein
MLEQAQGPKLVLLVEDDDDTRTIHQRLLRRCGFEVEAVATAEDALEVASTLRCDAAVLDIRLPGRSGVYLLKRLRLFAPIPAIACTAHVMRHEVASYLAAGFDEVVPKPIQPDDLLASLRRVLQLPPVVPRT